MTLMMFRDSDVRRPGCVRYWATNIDKVDRCASQCAGASERGAGMRAGSPARLDWRVATSEMCVFVYDGAA